MIEIKNILLGKFSKGIYGLMLLLFCSFAAINSGDHWQKANEEDVAKDLKAVNVRLGKLKKYRFDVVYKSYKGHESNVVYDKSEGSVIRDGVYFRSYTMGKLVVQNKDYQVIVDSANRVIKVNNPKEDIEFEYSSEQALKSMSACKAIMVQNTEGTQAYRFEMKANRGVVAQEMYFGEKFLKQVVVYYVQMHSVRHNNSFVEELVYPKLVMDFENFEIPKKTEAVLFDTSPYVRLHKGKLMAQGIYKNYKLIDGRYYK